MTGFGRIGSVKSPPKHQSGIGPLFLVLGIVLVILIGGTAGYVISGFSLLDAAYMTVMALTTIGFTPDRPFTSGEKILTAGISLAGVSTFLAFLAMAVQVVSEGQIGQGRRTRKMLNKIGSMQGHYIICAYGRVGRAVARELEGEQVSYVVIESLEDLEEQMIMDGVLHLLADPTSEGALKQAGIDRAKALVCAVDSDSANVFITLTARSMNPDLFIVARAGEAASVQLMQKAGANRVVSPYATSGRHMGLLAMRPKVVDTVDVFGIGGARVDELIVEEGSNLAGRSVGDACGTASPLVIQRGGRQITNPDPSETLREGDLILLLGEPEQLRPVEE